MRGAAWALGSRVVMLSVSLILAVLTARLLDPAARGAWVLGGLFAGIPALVGKAVSQAVAFDLGGAGRRGGGRDEALAVGWRLVHIMTLAVGVPALIGATVWSLAGGWGLSAGALVAASVGSYWLLSVPYGRSLADGDMRAAAVQFAGPVVGGLFGVLAAVAVFGETLDAVAWGSMVGTLVGSLPGLGPAPFRGLLQHRVLPLAPRLRFTAVAAGSGLVGFASSRVDVALLGVFEDTRAVGFYSLAVTAGETVALFGWSLATARYGAIGLADRATAARLSRRVAMIALLVGAVYGVGLGLVGHDVVAAVFGERFRVVGDYVWFIIPGGIALGAAPAVNAFLTNRLGRTGAVLLVSAVNVGVTAALCVVAIPTFGPSGAAVATSVGSVASLIVAWFLAFSHHGADPDSTVDAAHA